MMVTDQDELFAMFSPLSVVHTWGSFVWSVKINGLKNAAGNVVIILRIIGVSNWRHFISFRIIFVGDEFYRQATQHFHHGLLFAAISLSAPK